jgi:hypothetical protein
MNAVLLCIAIGFVLCMIIQMALESHPNGMIRHCPWII